MDVVLDLRPPEALATVAAGLNAGQLVPYLGPGVAAAAASATPMTPEALAEFFGTKVALPKRARGSAWASAQHIESYKHRNTVTAFMSEAFGVPVPPTAFHIHLASLGLPLIIDTWYTGEMRQALAGRTDWAEVQGITRAGIGEDRWFRFYGPDGAEIDVARAASAVTLLYTPHGSTLPARNFLISDADYVEVLTEIDIQTPIAECVRERRTGKSFLFAGCRFHDQLLRSYARQIMKRSRAQHYAIVDLAGLTRNERRFLDEQNIVAIDTPLEEALKTLIAG